MFSLAVLVAGSLIPVKPVIYRTYKYNPVDSSSLYYFSYHAGYSGGLIRYELHTPKENLLRHVLVDENGQELITYEEEGHPGHQVFLPGSDFRSGWVVRCTWRQAECTTPNSILHLVPGQPPESFAVPTGCRQATNGTNWLVEWYHDRGKAVFGSGYSSSSCILTPETMTYSVLQFENQFRRLVDIIPGHSSITMAVYLSAVKKNKIAYDIYDLSLDSDCAKHGCVRPFWDGSFVRTVTYERKKSSQQGAPIDLSEEYAKRWVFTSMITPNTPSYQDREPRIDVTGASRSLGNPVSTTGYYMICRSTDGDSAACMAQDRQYGRMRGIMDIYLNSYAKDIQLDMSPFEQAATELGAADDVRFFLSQDPIISDRRAVNVFSSHDGSYVIIWGTATHPSSFYMYQFFAASVVITVACIVLSALAVRQYIKAQRGESMTSPVPQGECSPCPH